MRASRRVSHALGALAVLIGLAASGASASAATVVVGNCMGASGLPTITAGVSVANPGDTVEVCPGTYVEQVPIIENITLTGIPGKANPVLTYPATPECFFQPDMTSIEYCPEIYVYSTASPTIERITLDGSNFPIKCSGPLPDHYPTGVLFQDSGGTVRDSQIVNQASCNFGEDGAGVVAFPTVEGDNSLTITGNTITNYGTFAISITGIIYPSATVIDESGTISNNTITNDDLSQEVILTSYTTNLRISGNTINGGGVGTGLNDSDDTDLTISLNTINNVCGDSIYLQFLDHATVNFNTLNDPPDCPDSAGVLADCMDLSSIAFNTITGPPGPPEPASAGIILYSCGGEGPHQKGSSDNTIVLNSIQNFCAGVLTGSPADTDNNIIFNAFANISPGLDVMPGDSCPAPGI